MFLECCRALSEKSVKEDGAKQSFPDFTRGNWRVTSLGNHIINILIINKTFSLSRNIFAQNLRYGF